MPNRITLLTAITGLCILATVAAAQAAVTLPDGKGKAEFVRICGKCHGVDSVVGTTNTPEGWADVVEDMVSRGAAGTADELDLVVAYLAEHFGPKLKINTAAEKELTEALGISETDARAIVRYRRMTGAFKGWDDLRKAPDIDMKKLEGQKDRIDFAPPGK
jgi:competence protein ComEA